MNKQSKMSEQMQGYINEHIAEMCKKIDGYQIIYYPVANEIVINSNTGRYIITITKAS